MKKFFLLLCSIVICFSNTIFSQIVLKESFDDTSFVPAGWYKAKIYPANFPAAGQWERVATNIAATVNPHSGAAMARFNSPTAGIGTVSELGTSVLNLSSGGPYRLRCWVYRADNAPNRNDNLEIYINTQQNITAAFKLGSLLISRMKTPSETANGWYEYLFDLPASFNTSANYIIFRATGASSNVVYIDDVVVERYTCSSPVTVSVTNVLTTTATLNWTTPVTGSPSGYEWEVRTNGSGGTGATGLAASGTTAQAATTTSTTGLAPGIIHYFYVRSSCGNDKSTWSNAVAFNTQCDPSSIPYTENFDGITSGIPACTLAENVNGGDTWLSSLPSNGSSYSNSAPNAISCVSGGAGSSGAQNDWFYTAALTLEAGKCYQLSFAYRTFYWPFTQSLKVNVGTAQNASSMSGAELFNNASITNDSYKTSLSNFSVPSTGIYFIGFNYYGAIGNGPILIDDIGVTVSVGPPTGINASPIGSTTVQLNWSVPDCGSATGYEWELRTSGAAGAGTTGLNSSGNGTDLFNSFTGLTENKSFTFYIRSKSSSITGTWSNGFTFLTNCSIRPLPYVQNFDSVIAPALPPCIIKQDLAVVYNPWNTWLNVSYDRPNSLPNCIRVGTNNSSYTGNNWFFTPPFNFTAGKSYRLNFYYRDNDYIFPEKLEVKYGAGANAAAMTSAAIYSNTTIRNPLFKKAVIDFVPSQNGIYNLGFHYFSDAIVNFLYIDDIKVEETPACDVVKEITATNITATSAIIKWLAPQTGAPSAYKWELRVSGSAGGGATGLVSSGTLAAGSLSVPLSNLTASTMYTFYISSMCGTQSSEWVPYTFAAACNAVNVPYNENFDGLPAPAYPTCTKIEEQFDNYYWYTATGYSRSSPNSLIRTNLSSNPFNDWFFSAPLQLVAGKSYRLSFYFRQHGSGYTDAFEIKIGNYAQGDAMSPAPVYTNSNVTSTSYQLATVTFTVPASGVYYLGLHSITSSYARGLSIDDMNVNEVNPDLIITHQSVSSLTAARSETITANFTIANQGLTSAVPHKTYFYLSPDTIFTPGANGDTLIGTYSNATDVGPNANTGNVGKQLNISCSVIPGRYTLFFVADGDSIINEINETNNTVATAITITPGSIWNGSVSTDWETAGNWSCNMVPDASTDVIINNGTVILHANTTIKSLFVKPGVHLTVAPAIVLSIKP